MTATMSIFYLQTVDDQWVRREPPTSLVFFFIKRQVMNCFYLVLPRRLDTEDIGDGPLDGTMAGGKYGCQWGDWWSLREWFLRATSL